MLGGGPLGCLGSVAIWIGAELAATFIKVILTALIGKTFTRYFGVSDTWELAKSIYTYFVKSYESGLTSTLEWMQDYIQSTQRKKKLA